MSARPHTTGMISSPGTVDIWGKRGYYGIGSQAVKPLPNITCLWTGNAASRRRSATLVLCNPFLLAAVCAQTTPVSQRRTDGPETELPESGSVFATTGRSCRTFREVGDR